MTLTTGEQRNKKGKERKGVTTGKDRRPQPTWVWEQHEGSLTLEGRPTRCVIPWDGPHVRLSSPGMVNTYYQYVLRHVPSGDPLVVTNKNLCRGLTMS